MVAECARNAVCVKPHAFKHGRVAVYGPLIKKPELIQHFLAAIYNAVRVHNLAQAQYAAFVHELLHVLRNKLRPAVLKRRCRHAGGQHEKHPQRQLVSQLIHGAYARSTRNVCNFVRVGNNGCGAVGHYNLHEGGGYYHAAFYVHMRVYEAGRKVSAAGVYFVFAAVTANAYYNVLVYRYVRANNLVRKNVHNVRVFYNQRVLPFVCRAYQLALPHGVPFRF